MCSHWSLRTKAWSSEDWLPGPQREMWQMPGQQVPCPRTTGACPHARCCSNTDGLPRSHPHQFQGLCSFLLPYHPTPLQVYWTSPECFLSTPPTWSKEHCPAQGPGPSTEPPLCPALTAHTHITASPRPWSDSTSVLTAAPGGQAQPLELPGLHMQSRPSAPSDV